MLETRNLVPLVELRRKQHPKDSGGPSGIH
jgi:hypothetical protein